MGRGGGGVEDKQYVSPDNGNSKIMAQMMSVESIFFEIRFKLGFVLRVDVKFRELESLVNSDFFSPLVHLSRSNFLDLIVISCFQICAEFALKWGDLTAK